MIRTTSLAFPHDEHMPAERLKPIGGSTVTSSNSLELWYPVPWIGLRRPRKPASGVLVPKASVDKDCDTQPGQDNIRSSRQVTPMQSEPEAGTVENSTSRHLRACVLGLDTPHPSRDFRIDGTGRCSVRRHSSRANGAVSPAALVHGLPRALPSAFWSPRHSAI